HDLAGDTMHGKPHALHTEADRARAEISFARDVETMTFLGPSGIEFRKGDLSVRANDVVVLQPAIGSIATGITARELENIIAERKRRFLDSLTGHDRAGAR